MNDADHIHAEVERRKARARELGLPASALRFTEEYAGVWPAWAKSDPEMIPSAVHDVQGGDDILTPSLSFNFEGRRIKIHFERDVHSDSHRGEPYWWGQLSIAVDDRVVLGLTAIGSNSEFSPIAWTECEITAFVEDDWVPSFHRLCAEAQAHQASQEALRETRRREDPDLLESLTERFGLSSPDASGVATSSQLAVPSEGPRPAEQPVIVLRSEKTGAASLSDTESAWYRLGRLVRRFLSR